VKTNTRHVIHNGWIFPTWYELVLAQARSAGTKAAKKQKIAAPARDFFSQNNLKQT